ncbi:MAG: hypothetical protein KDA85_04265 [Planctomycetaceae bacterium]|nr:hypothetical protein [Planctomycetaceae bacterium]
MLSQLERRFGRFAVPHATLAIIAFQVVVYVIGYTDPTRIEPLFLIPANVLGGEVHRLVTFIAIPPFESIPLFQLFYWYLFFLMGESLEQYWGTFRFNVFLLVGYSATVAASFLAPDVPATNEFIQGSIFLAFAFLNPDFRLYVFFILPIRIWWFALLAWIFYGVVILFAPWAEKVTATASLLNFFLFFWPHIVAKARGGHRSMRRGVKRFSQKPPEFLHRCHVCGRTDTSNPELDFRYCSKCRGDYCYCNDHLRDHVHIESTAASEQ